MNKHSYRLIRLFLIFIVILLLNLKLIGRTKNMNKMRAIITDTNSNQKSQHIEKPYFYLNKGKINEYRIVY